jgi:chemotaxis protein methyltransferase CheR
MGDTGTFTGLATTRQYRLTDAEFARLRQLVYQHTGIALTDSKRELVYGRLSKRLRAKGLGSFSEYCALVDRQDPGELQELTNAITTNLTSFFRENHHFRQLADVAIPEAVARHGASHRLRVWSAGCSTGEEPYSIAMVLREMDGLRHWNVKLLATDIDSCVLDQASHGVYAADRLEGMVPARRARWFRPTDDDSGRYVVSAELRELITFRRLNLLEPWQMHGPLDVIFCRNVAIYFDKPTQRTLFRRMADLQEPGGWLFVGHSENLFNVTDRYELVGQTAYRRV